ncbi:MAG: alpha/beta fold hydrolase [Chlamydiae bacterium]|nr:alpha/beta fold hydrolase [Chlamydiota bacterium]
MFLLLSLILILIYTLHYFYTSLKPPRFITPLTPAHYGLKWENVSFKTGDGLCLKGWWIPHLTSQQAIIICHGYPFDKGNVLPLSIFLHENYPLLFFDFRAMGESEGNVTTLGYRETRDIEAALDFLETKGIHEVALMGLSLGASTCLLASRDPRVQAMIADSPFASLNQLLDETLCKLGPAKKIFKILLVQLGRWFLKIDIAQVEPLKTIREGKIPILLIHGDKDTYINPSHSMRLKKARPDIEFWLVPDSQHGEAHERYPEEYEKRMNRFLEKNF